MLLAFCLFSGCATTSSEQPDEPDFYYKMGLSYINEGNLQAAFVQFQKSLKLAPGNKEALNSLGRVYMQWEDYNQAKELFLKALAVDSEFSDAYNNLGVTYRELGLWNEAMESFKKALSNPLYNSPEFALYNLGVCYYRSGQFELAVNTFKDSVKRSPRFSLPYYGLALTYNKTGRYGDAVTILERAIELDPSYKGDRTKFIADISQKLLTLRGSMETDFRDYLEIMKY